MYACVCVVFIIIAIVLYPMNRFSCIIIGVRYLCTIELLHVRSGMTN